MEKGYNDGSGYFTIISITVIIIITVTTVTKFTEFIKEGSEFTIIIIKEGYEINGWSWGYKEGFWFYICTWLFVVIIKENYSIISKTIFIIISI